MPYNLIDTHTHLYYHYETEEFENQIDRCLEAGVNKLIFPNVDSESIDKVLNSSKEYSDICYPMMGLHPCSVDENYQSHLEVIKEQAYSTPIVAIGEIGIDLHWDKETLPFQKEAFKMQLDWAIDLGLPVSIHCRKAFEPLLEILSDYKSSKLSGVLHCFTEGFEEAQKCIDLGLHLGVGGVITYKNAQELKQAIREIDLKHLVLETDSPYLSPVPFRGKPNESSYLVYVAKEIAAIKGINTQTVAEETTRNAERIFNLQ